MGEGLVGGRELVLPGRGDGGAHRLQESCGGLVVMRGRGQCSWDKAISIQIGVGNWLMLL